MSEGKCVHFKLAKDFIIKARTETLTPDVLQNKSRSILKYSPTTNIREYG